MKNKTIGYIRVSTVDQDPEKNRSAILDYSNKNNFGKVEFVEEKISGATNWRKRKLNDVVDSLRKGDKLIVPELSRVGRSLVQVLEVLNVLKDKGVSVYSVKEGFELNGNNMQAKIMSTMLALFAEIERDLISMRTKEALFELKKSGVKLGRPRGKGKSRLDEFREEIIALLKNGSRKQFVYKKFKVTAPTLDNWLRKNEIDATPEF